VDVKSVKINYRILKTDRRVISDFSIDYIFLHDETGT
jgi:hypothetical protein